MPVRRVPYACENDEGASMTLRLVCDNVKISESERLVGSKCLHENYE